MTALINIGGRARSPKLEAKLCLQLLILIIMRQWHFEMMCRGDSREQLQAIIDSEFILKQLSCPEHMTDSVRLLQKAGLNASALDGWPIIKAPETVKQQPKKNKKRRKKKKQSGACSGELPGNDGFETICRRLSTKEETLEALGPDIDGILEGTPDAERFVDVLNSYMNTYLKVSAVLYRTRP